MWVKVVAPIIGLVLLLLVLLVAIVAIPVIAVIANLYNSPFALFLPPLESGDSVQTVTSAYVSEFNRDVNTKVNGHAGCDIGELVYVDYEGMEENPSNYYDIMAVYMVKYGVGDTATVMNDKSKGWLQTVVNDMCSYTTSSSRNYDVLGRELFTPDEVRKLDNKKDTGWRIHPTELFDFVHQLLHIRINHSHGSDIDHLSHTTFKIGEVNGFVQAHLYRANDFRIIINRLQQFVGIVGAAQVGKDQRVDILAFQPRKRIF